MSYESAFQFSRPVLCALNICVNENFEPAEEGKIKLNITTHVKKKEYIQETSENVAEVVLTIEIGSKDDASAPFYIFAEESAHFKWPEGTFCEADTNRLLKGNAPSLLLSYLRPIISMVTSATVFPDYNIPFIDLTKNID